MSENRHHFCPRCGKKTQTMNHAFCVSCKFRVDEQIRRNLDMASLFMMNLVLQNTPEDAAKLFTEPAYKHHREG